MSERTYGEDLALLGEHVEVAELAAGSARLAVAPDWQGRVMTSTLDGPDAPGFGWLNAPFIESGADDPAFNNYGGEDRFWLGPEAGQFGLWFDEGRPFEIAHWRTPEPLNRAPFAVTSRGERSVAMASQFRVTNRAGAAFDCAVQRTVNLLDAERAGKLLGQDVPTDVSMVGFESENVLVNDGETPWTRDDGLLSVWILGQFKPLARGRVLAPVRPGNDTDLGPRARTDYFGTIPADRCFVGEQYVTFACDGQYRSKIGISPRRSRGRIGSYDPVAEVLTVVQFNQPLTAAELPYVNSLWREQDEPFSGDAINAYNDGPQPDGTLYGPFYELETSSPAAVLAPGDALTHSHRTFHLSGPFEQLRLLCDAALGIDLKEIRF